MSCGSRSSSTAALCGRGSTPATASSTPAACAAGNPRPPPVTDPRRVRQILLNLLSNAIKFGLHQPITVECARKDDGGVSISVVDHGEGIAEEDQPRIFEEFVQVSPTQQMGTGLGLPISRRLASLLDGSLDVESKAGSGSRFTLNLPPEGTARVYDPEEFPDESGVEKGTENEAEKASEKPPEKAMAHGVRVA